MSDVVPSRSGSGEVAFQLAQLGGLAAARFAERIESLRLTPAKAGLLRVVGHDPARSQQAVAAQLGLLPSRLVILVDELERDGLIERRRNPTDRRHHALHLTSTGEQRLRDVGRIAGQHGEDLLAPLTDPERVSLGQLLTRLATHHGLTPGVHPGYRAPGRPATADSRAG